MGGAIIFLALFHQNYILWQQTNMSRSCDPYSNIKKRKNITIFQISLKAVLSLIFLASTVNDVRRKLQRSEYT